MIHRLFLKFVICESFLFLRNDDMFVKVEGNQYVKNTENSALLTVNKAAIAENEARKMLAKKLNGKNDEINTLKDKVEDLSSDISEIKSMLKQILK